LKNHSPGVILSEPKDQIYSFSKRQSRFLSALGMTADGSGRRKAKGLSLRLDRFRYLVWTLLALAGCLLGLAVSGAAVAGQKKPTITLPSRVSPQARQLLDQTVQALGGDAFLHYKTITTAGHVFAISHGQTAGFAPFKSTFEPPDKRRFSYGKGKPVVLINNGDAAWELDRLGRTHQNPEQARNWKIANRYSLDNVFRYRIHATGVLILASSPDFVANQPVDVIDIIDAQNIHVRVYVHHSTHLPVRIAYRVQNPNTHEWEEYADDYSDYQTFQGIATPMHVARYLDGERIGELFRNKVTYNQPIPPDYFEPPR
jgi:hypothetical protein